MALPSPNLVEHRSSETQVLACREHLVRFHDVDQMMWHSLSLCLRQFCRADIEMSIYLDGIAVNNLSAKRQGQINCQSRLATAGRASHNNERRIHRGKSK